MRTKTVRFYRPVVLDQNDVQQATPAKFWTAMIAATQKAAAADRVLARSGSAGDYYGRVSAPDQKAPYLRIGRLRGRSDFPDTIDLGAGGTVDDMEVLELDGRRVLFESAYVVPFGTGSRVAVMGPIRGLVHPSAIAEWLTFISGMTLSNLRVELVAEYDEQAIAKLMSAEGVSRILVRFPAGSEIDDINGETVDADLPDADGYRAITAATEQRPSDAEITISMSTGHRTPAGTISDLRTTVLKVLGRGPDKVEATMKLRNSDGTFDTETHDLIRDNIALDVKFDVREDETLDELAVLEAIGDAVVAFNRMRAPR